MKGVTPLTQLAGLNQEQLKEHCEHIISHAERYEKERVFEAIEILNNTKEGLTMKKVRLYKVTCTESYMINEQGEGYKLYPWGNDTQDYKGHDDGGNYYVLPEGYEIAKNNSGEVEIYKGGKHCEILMHHSGLPQLISGDKEMPVLKKLTK